MPSFYSAYFSSIESSSVQVSPCLFPSLFIIAAARSLASRIWCCRVYGIWLFFSAAAATTSLGDFACIWERERESNDMGRYANELLHFL